MWSRHRDNPHQHSPSRSKPRCCPFSCARMARPSRPVRGIDVVRRRDIDCPRHRDSRKGAKNAGLARAYANTPFADRSPATSCPRLLPTPPEPHSPRLRACALWTAHMRHPSNTHCRRIRPPLCVMSSSHTSPEAKSRHLRSRPRRIGELPSPLASHGPSGALGRPLSARSPFRHLRHRHHSLPPPTSTQKA